MEPWPEHQRRVEALEQVSARLAEAPEEVASLFERAKLLAQLGRTDAARQAYLETLQRDPTHFGALNDLGVLLQATGYRTAARTAFSEAVARHPSESMARVNLANLLRDAGELVAARAEYGRALALDPDHAEAHKGLALLLLETGEEEAALAHQRAGFRAGAVTVLPYRGQAQPIPVLLLVSAAKGNAPFQKLLDDQVYFVTVIAAEHFGDGEPLPPHRLVVNAIGDADLCGEALRSAERIVARTLAPVLNRPSAVLATGRAANAERLAALPGLVAPATATVSREALAGLPFPYLLRSPGFHTGLHFRRVDGEAELAEALATLPGRELTRIQILASRSPDGLFRKYRIMMVDGHFYPAHCAVSSHWKVHYFSADMAGHPERRAEDEAFLRDPEAVVGAPALRTLEGLRDALGLDYAGVDFGVADGQVLLFEANAAMTVNAPEPEDRWAYRREPVARLHEAVRGLVRRLS